MKNILQCFESLKKKQNILSYYLNPFMQIFSDFNFFICFNFLRKISASNQAQQNGIRIQLFYYKKQH